MKVERVGEEGALELAAGKEEVQHIIEGKHYWSRREGALQRFCSISCASIPLSFKSSSAQIISSGQLFGSLPREMLHKLLALQIGALSRLAFTDPIKHINISLYS